MVEPRNNERLRPMGGNRGFRLTKLSQPQLQIGRVDEGLFDCLLQQTPGASWDSRMGTSCETFQDCDQLARVCHGYREKILRRCCL